jgi:hypothetical protein
LNLTIPLKVGHAHSIISPLTPRLNKKPRYSSTLDRGSGSPDTARSSSIKGVVRFGSPASHVSALSHSTNATSSSNSTIASPSRTLKLWTMDEDRKLLDAIAANNYDLVWPRIAEAVPNRTGKQCRERYLNHLKPSLKVARWAVHEDAMIFRLYSTSGSKWAKMVRFLPGRTDNSIKNRYHHVLRRFEKQMQSVDSSFEIDRLMNKIQDSLLSRGVKVNPFVLKYLALKISHHPQRHHTSMDREYCFGPFHFVDRNIGCSRCGLVVPSQQTGRYVCTRTGWCQSCTGMSPIISRDSLRVLHTINERHQTSSRRPCQKRQQVW